MEAFVEAGVDHVICLQEEHEFARYEPPETLEERARAVEALGIRFSHEEVEDFEAPTMEQARRVVGWVREDLEAGLAVVVHCRAGLGRAGTIAACVLIEEGMGAADAIATVRYFRFGAIQSEAQERLIQEYAEALGR
jgi:protein-tyrosine phosphatase